MLSCRIAIDGTLGFNECTTFFGMAWVFTLTAGCHHYCSRNVFFPLLSDSLHSVDVDCVCRYKSDDFRDMYPVPKTMLEGS